MKNLILHSLLAFSMALVAVMPHPAVAAPGLTISNGLVAHWAFESLEKADGRVVTRDLASGRRDEVRGHSRLQEGVRGNCMVLNEYDRELLRPDGSGPLIKSKSFTVEAWIAPRSYPWNWAPILMQRDDHSGFFFGIDGDGRLGLHVAVGGKWFECNSQMPFAGLLTEHQWNSDSRKWQYFGPGNPPAPEPFGEKAGKPTIPLLRWSHVVGTFDPSEGIIISPVHDGRIRMTAMPVALDATWVRVRVLRLSPVPRTGRARVTRRSSRRLGACGCRRSFPGGWMVSWRVVE